MLDLGDIKYTYTPYNKKNNKIYIKKEEKPVNKVDTPVSPPKLIRSATTRDRRYTFLIQEWFIMRDLMKSDLFKPLENHHKMIISHR